MSPEQPDLLNPSTGPSTDETLKALDKALEEATAATPGLWCFVPILVGVRAVPCGRPRTKVQDLCCLDHWKLLPKKLRVPVIEANKLRSERQRERASILAADKAVDYLTSLSIQIPPVERLVRDEPRIIRPDGIQRPDALVSSNSKLIIER